MNDERQPASVATGAATQAVMHQPATAPADHPRIVEQAAVQGRAADGVTADPWPALRDLTPARLALGRAGCSLPTAGVLRFGLAHAQARDAVHHPLDVAALADRLYTAGFASLPLSSAAADRWQYLARPDLGRRLAADSRDRLATAAQAFRPATPGGIAVVLADGLSALAVERHAVPVLLALAAQLADDEVLRCALALRQPVVVASQARVALGDEIGALLAADLVLVMIGERPGLSSPDSLGLYVTWAPRIGRTDAERNCISNVRPAGLPPAAAARELCLLLRRIAMARCSGIALSAADAPQSLRHRSEN